MVGTSCAAGHYNNNFSYRYSLVCKRLAETPPNLGGAAGVDALRSLLPDISQMQFNLLMKAIIGFIARYNAESPNIDILKEDLETLLPSITEQCNRHSIDFDEIIKPLESTNWHSWIKEKEQLAIIPPNDLRTAVQNIDTKDLDEFLLRQKEHKELSEVTSHWWSLTRPYPYLIGVGGIIIASYMYYHHRCISKTKPPMQPHRPTRQY